MMMMMATRKQSPQKKPWRKKKIKEEEDKKWKDELFLALLLNTKRWWTALTLQQITGLDQDMIATPSLSWLVASWDSIKYIVVVVVVVVRAKRKKSLKKWAHIFTRLLLINGRDEWLPCRRRRAGCRLMTTTAKGKASTENNNQCAYTRFR